MREYVQFGEVVEQRRLADVGDTHNSNAHVIACISRAPPSPTRTAQNHMLGLRFLFLSHSFVKYRNGYEEIADKRKREQ